MMRVQEGHFYRHKKTGNIYCVQCKAKLEADRTPVIVYRSEKNNSLWVRPEAEFCDGRFEHIDDFRELEIA